MTPVGTYIPLERRFAEPSESKDSEDLALRSYLGRAMGVSSDIAWPDIYRDGRSCVILGEAGSGKSREMEEQMRLLRGTGVAAAYVRTTRRREAVVEAQIDPEDDRRLRPSGGHRGS